jgi:hypothetical protein
VVPIELFEIELRASTSNCQSPALQELLRLDDEASKNLLESSGVKAVKLPARSPNLNAYAERFVLSTKSEVLHRASAAW